MCAALLMVYALLAEPAVVDAWRPVMPAPARLDPLAVEQFHPTRWRRPLWDLLAADPLLAPTLAETGARGFAGDGGRLAPTLERFGQRAGLGVTRSLTFTAKEPLADRLLAELGDRPFASALTRLRQAGGMARPADDPETGDLPPELDRAAGALLAAVRTGLAWRARAFEQAPAGGLSAALDDLRRFAVPDTKPGGPDSFEHQRRLDRLMAGFDVPAMAAAADDLALVLDRVLPTLRPVPGWQTRRWATPLGEVVLAGDSADDHTGQPPLLLIDLGGDDHYRPGACAVDERHPFSVVIDLAGNDSYEAEGGLGAAVGGVAMQIDLAGNDRYRAGSLAEGVGIGGVGLLYDAAGDDDYVGSIHCQGAGALGFGLLIDGGGNDHYTATARAQGHGYALGAGLLLDAGDGADSYRADGLGDELDGAALAQGCGFGRRSDGTDGHSLAGGLGWLVDGGGNDTYQSASLSQGAGYAYGVGLLTDLGGNDQHDCAGQGCGLGAQAGIGIAWDAAGDDGWTLTPRRPTTAGLGAGVDFGLGWLADLAGSDRYTLAGVGLGGASVNGLGFCWDAGGDDTYQAEGGPALGRGQTAPRPELLATSLRRAFPTLGFLLDSGGTDHYTGPLKRP